MTMSGDDAMSKAGRVSARRIEVFTGVGRRRDWSNDQKAAIVAESYAGDASVSDVARRHGSRRHSCSHGGAARAGRLSRSARRIRLPLSPPLLRRPARTLPEQASHR